MDEWKSSVDEALSGVETGRVDAIIKAQQDYVAQALAGGGMPSVKKLMYFAELMQAEQKASTRSTKQKKKSTLRL
ncbi:MAG TPA: hypothetical protein PLL37_11485 [Bacillota bacterium]|nr:hypothetical protein [Bacillota bacterium]